jgi:hypothetical protein
MATTGTGDVSTGVRAWLSRSLISDLLVGSPVRSEQLRGWLPE